MPLKKFKERLYKYFLKKRLSKTSIPRKNINFQEVKKIAILFNATDPENYIIIQRHIKNYKALDKKVDLLGYFDFKKIEGDFNFPFFCKKDLNFYLQPNNALDHFLNKDYDLLINAYTEKNLPLEYLSTFSKAKFRIGAYKKEKEYYADFMVSSVNNGDLESVLKEIDHYLKAINTYER